MDSRKTDDELRFRRNQRAAQRRRLHERIRQAAITAIYLAGVVMAVLAVCWYAPIALGR